MTEPFDILSSAKAIIADKQKKEDAAKKALQKNNDKYVKLAKESEDSIRLSLAKLIGHNTKEGSISVVETQHKGDTTSFLISIGSKKFHKIDIRFERSMSTDSWYTGVLYIVASWPINSTCGIKNKCDWFSSHTTTCDVTQKIYYSSRNHTTEQVLSAVATSLTDWL